MPYRVPFVDPRLHYRKLQSEIDAAIHSCLAQGDLVYRKQLKDFEEHLAEFVGVKYAVGVNSGYHALYFSLLASGIGPGDEVITVAHTFVATISAIVHTGATPVLVDVGSDDNVDPNAVEAAVTKRTKGILPVHLNGNMCNMERLSSIARRHGLWIIEDAAQALGASEGEKRAGSFGIAGCFSFYPFKILGGFGDGGAVTTNDPDVARMASLLRYNGEDRSTGEYHYHGQTALLDNVQAAVLDVKLRHLPAWIEHRRDISFRYSALLKDVPGIRLPELDRKSQRSVCQNFVIKSPERDRLRAHLAERGVETLVHWPKPVWEHAALGLPTLDLPNTLRLCREVVSLPLSAEIELEQADYVAECVREFAGATLL